MKRKATIAPLSPAACHAAMATARAVAKRNGPRLVLRREEGNHVLEFSDFEEPDCLGLGWAFRGTADDEAAALLRLFLDDALRPRTAGGTIIRFELGLHFARLLAEKGALVAGELAAALDLPDRDWGRFDILARRQLLLAGLAALPESGRRIVELLDIVPEDFRDGLFLACWFDGEAAVQRKLFAKFGEWTADPKWGGGSGEEGWLYIFLTKWTSKNTFPFRRLEPLIRWKLERDFRRNENPHPATNAPALHAESADGAKEPAP